MAKHTIILQEERTQVRSIRLEIEAETAEAAGAIVENAEKNSEYDTLLEEVEAETQHVETTLYLEYELNGLTYSERLYD